MASLPTTFDKHLRKALGARSVWPIGSPIEIGDIIVKGDGLFNKVGNIREFGAVAQTAPHVDKSLDFTSSKVKQRIFQANAEVGKDELDLAADASVKLEFASKTQFAFKTSALSGESIQNLLVVGAKLAGATGWDHDNFYIAHETYGAANWTFLGTKESSGDIQFSGKGSGILSFLTAGITAGLTQSGNLELVQTGTSGKVAMNLARVKKDGSIDF